jgi:hypothetical protein
MSQSPTASALLRRLDEIAERFDDLQQKLQDPAVLARADRAGGAAIS